MENHGKITQQIIIDHPCVGSWIFILEAKFDHFFSIREEDLSRSDFQFLEKIEKYQERNKEEICVLTILFNDGEVAGYYVKPKIHRRDGYVSLNPVKLKLHN